MAAPRKHSLLPTKPISTTGLRSTSASSPPSSVSDSEALAMQLLMQLLPALPERQLPLVSPADSSSIIPKLIVVLQLKLVRQPRMLSMLPLASRGLPQQLLPSQPRAQLSLLHQLQRLLPLRHAGPFPL